MQVGVVRPVGLTVPDWLEARLRRGLRSEPSAPRCEFGVSSIITTHCKTTADHGKRNF